MQASQSLTARSAAVDAVKAYIGAHHQQHISWHLTLNNHTSTRPKKYGGPTIATLSEVKTFEEAGPGSASLVVVVVVLVVVVVVGVVVVAVVAAAA